MELSVIVVNYNVCRLLKQAVASLIEAAKDVEHEIIVVDNASADNSVAMLQQHFPEVKVISNDTNECFAKAANQGIRAAKGDFVLLVNPDTVCSDDTLQKTLNFVTAHTDAGAVGVRMINGSGQFLPESKRGITGQWGTFLKLTGLARYFPKSRLSKRYDAGWIEEFETAEVDVVNGAFMLLRKSVLNLTGLLDENFKIYGADIDLSYRIKNAGYKNYYYPKTYIIHFKHQSIRKFSWTYLKNYYGAMFIFAAKYLFKMPSVRLKPIQRLYPTSYELER
jgi:GT2 family glycosyltransferase